MNPTTKPLFCLFGLRRQLLTRKTELWTPVEGLVISWSVQEGILAHLITQIKLREL